MNKVKYLYIDDENGASEISTLHGFNDFNLVEVERFPLVDFIEFGKLKLELIERINNNNFDGLIVDLRLDGTGENRTEFNATALSQELRSVAAQGDIRTFPIVLCSTEEKIKKTYNSDKTSHDLFDYKISKSNPHPDWAKLSTKLLSLANGYLALNQSNLTLEQVLGLQNRNSLDQRIVEKMDSLVVHYDFSHFIIKNFLHQTNPLINEKILAARLGIDINKTPRKSWSKLKLDYFSSACYSGLFSDGWNRWWADDIVDIFLKASGERLAFLKAEQRVDHLKKITGIYDLVEAKPLKFCNSSEFWTICEGYKVPIDPLEAFKIAVSVDLKPWQESKYISLLAILEREGYTDRGLRVHPSELEKLAYTTELLKTHERQQ
ncbi:MAG: hypothetical protein ACYCOO_12015 [Chitinophagaceae bacterium]